MTPNMKQMQAASKLTSQMIAIVDEYERGYVTGAAGVQYPLTPAQVNLQKQEFADRRALCIAALNAVTG